jgi:hypothetical protein
MASEATRIVHIYNEKTDVNAIKVFEPSDGEFRQIQEIAPLRGLWWYKNFDYPVRYFDVEAFSNNVIIYKFVVES